MYVYIIYIQISRNSPVSNIQLNFTLLLLLFLLHMIILICGLSPLFLHDFMEIVQGPEPMVLRPKFVCRTTGDPITDLRRNLESKSAMGGSRKLTCLFPFSGSVKDLRGLELEREKTDEFSPRGVLEACNEEGLENQTASPKARNSWVSNRWHRFWKLWRAPKINRLTSTGSLSMPKVPKRKSMSAREHADDVSPKKSSWKNFTLSDLCSATNNFSQENLIGRGGYAEVYKGCLPDGQLVAIKRLNRGTSEDQVISFLSEVGIIAHVDHRNTAKMVGYGVEGGTFLVLQLSSLGSLGSLLRGSKETLTWGIRYKIMLGTADGLLYLHENCQRRIIHRDIKADNILLTEDFEPQICDFGLAKWLPKQWTHHNVSKFEGTVGYFAPEYFMHGIVDEKTDVYAFGVLLLEIITGRQALDESQPEISLILWAKPLLKKNDIISLADKSLADSYNPEEMNRAVLAASSCIQENPIFRPRMNQVVKMLRGDCENMDFSEDHKKILKRSYSEELLDVEEYNSTKHLTELSMRIKEIVSSP